MVRPKRSSARQSKAVQRESSAAPVQESYTRRLDHVIADGEAYYQKAVTKLRLTCLALEEEIDMMYDRFLQGFSEEDLDRPFKEVLREAGSSPAHSKLGTGEATCSTVKNMKTSAASTSKKGDTTTKRNTRLGSVRQVGRQSRSMVRGARTPVTSTSLPPKGIITPKFDTRRGRTPSLTRRAKPGEVLVSLSGSPVRSEHKLHEKTAAFITLEDGSIISIAPDTNVKQCKLGKDALAKLEALQQAVKNIMKNSVKS